MLALFVKNCLKDSLDVVVVIFVTAKDTRRLAHERRIEMKVYEIITGR